MPENAQTLFVCYRRTDTGVIGGRLHDWLTRRLGVARIFMDVYTNKGGEEWKTRVTQALNSARIFLPLIGPAWEKISLPSEDKPRLWNPDDLVRQEIEQALRTRKEIIPLLIDRPEFPAANCIPTVLHPIYEKHAISISSDHNFASGMDELAKRLDYFIFSRREEITCTLVQIEEDRNTCRARRQVAECALRRFGIRNHPRALKTGDQGLTKSMLDADLVVLLGASLPPEIAYLLGRRFELGRKPALLLHEVDKQIRFQTTARCIPYDVRTFAPAASMMEQALNELFLQ
jgi:hypothetical protein